MNNIYDNDKITLAIRISNITTNIIIVVIES